MSRRDRRKFDAQQRRNAKAAGMQDARDAPMEEQLVGGETDAQPFALQVMNTALKALADVAPQFDITIFMAEKFTDQVKAEGRLPRFNYGSTAHREDMYAVLQAFLEKNKHLDKKLEGAAAAPEGTQ
jgi:hypothetical protein